MSVLDKYNEKMEETSKAIFNPNGAYMLPAGDTWLPDLLYLDSSNEWSHTGPIRIPSGTSLVYDADLIGD